MGTLFSFAQARNRRLKRPAMRIRWVSLSFVIRAVKRAPPDAEASTGLPHAEVCVKNYAIDAVVTAIEKITVEAAQLVRHDR
jgi:hypothetical protein